MLSPKGAPSAHGVGKRNDLVRHLLRADRMNGDDLFALLNDPALRPRNVTRLVKDHLDDSGRQVVRIEFSPPQWRAITDHWPALVDLFYCAPIWLGLAFGGTVAINGRTATADPEFLPYLRLRPGNRTWASIVNNADFGSRTVTEGINPLDCTKLKLASCPAKPGQYGTIAPRDWFTEDALRMFREAAGRGLDIAPDEFEAGIRRWFRKADDHFATASAKLGKPVN